MKAMEPRVEETIAGQASWVVESGDVRVAVTQLGGHMAPVDFCRRSAGGPVRPYHVSPWQGQGLSVAPPVLVPLRGDFFCLPFGGDSTVKGVAHTTHGEPATAPWTFVSLDKSDAVTRLVLKQAGKKLPGTVTKTVSLVDGESVVYLSHKLQGFDCRTSLGHHATLAGGDRDDALAISTSPIMFGLVSPRPDATFESGGEYNALLPGASFRSLDKVPTIWKELPYDSIGSFPRRRGFCDIIQLFNKAGRPGAPAWVAAVNAAEGWLWFALKNPAVLPSTLFWMENLGRHASPWSGRNCCIGLEDVCSSFADGLAASTKRNDLNERGIATVARLSPGKPTLVNYIQGATRIPRGFDRVASVVFDEDSAVFVAKSGKKQKVAVRPGFVFSGSP
jgi:hypothetical protein